MCVKLRITQFSFLRAIISEENHEQLCDSYVLLHFELRIAQFVRLASLPRSPLNIDDTLHLPHLFHK